MTQFQQNIEFFATTDLFAKVKDFNSLVSKAELIYREANSEKDFHDWINSDEKILNLPWLLPRNKPDKKAKKTVNDIYSSICDNIESIVDNHEDIHTAEFGYAVYDFLTDTEIDIGDSTILLNDTGSRQLVSFGTSDGSALQWIISLLDPRKLIIIVDDWDEIVSSFWNLDWQKLTSHFTSDSRELVILRAHQEIEVANAICKDSILHVNNTAIVNLTGSNSRSYEYLQKWRKESMHNTIFYLGYTIDEYNMIINTLDTIKERPKILQSPANVQLVENICICGSGPSLDQSLSHLKNLQNSHLIIAAGSSVKTLLKNDIRVDLVLLVERALTMDDAFSDAIADSKHIPKLLMSSTCPAALVKRFQETTIFFRPALTPLSIFSTRPQQILDFEGPEAVNASLSIAFRLNPTNIVLFGVDLGSKNKSNYRSREAAGESPRDLDQLVESNFSTSKEIYTNKIFLDTKHVLSKCAETNNSKTTTLYNASDGAKILGFKPINPEDYCQREFLSPIDLSLFNQWWSSQPSYDENLLHTNWVAKNPRKSTFQLLTHIKSLINSTSNIDTWHDETIPKISSLLSLDSSLSTQIGKRIYRSTIYKCLLIINIALSLSKKNTEVNEDNLLKSLLLLLDKRLDRLIEESFSLFDHIDSKIQS